MAKTILLRYSNKALDKAIRTTTKIRDGLNSAIKAGNNVSANVGRLIEQEELLGTLQARRRSEQGRAQVSALSGGGRGGAQARLGIGRGAGGGFFGRISGAFGRLRGQGFQTSDLARGVEGFSAFRSLATGSLSSGFSFGAALLGGPAGAAAAVAIQAASLVKESLTKLFEEEGERQRKIILRDVRVELDQALADMAFDPGGNTERQQQIRSQFAKELKEEVASGRDAVWSDMSARLTGM